MSNKNSKDNENTGRNWLLKVFLITFLLSITFNYFSSEVVEKMSTPVSVIVLIFFLLLGVSLDLVSTAVTAADEAPFHAKAADKKRGAKESVKLIKNADKVSNFCADVIGDVCGVLTGATGALIAVSVASSMGLKDFTVITMFVTATITALTVFGKGACKKVAIKNANKIINFVGVCLSYLKLKKD